MQVPGDVINNSNLLQCFYIFIYLLVLFVSFKAIKRRKSPPSVSPREGGKVPQTVTLIRDQQYKGMYEKKLLLIRCHDFHLVH